MSYWEVFRQADLRHNLFSSCKSGFWLSLDEEYHATKFIWHISLRLKATRNTSEYFLNQNHKSRRSARWYFGLPLLWYTLFWRAKDPGPAICIFFEKANYF